MSTIGDLNKVKEKNKKEKSGKKQGAIARKKHPMNLIVNFFTWIQLALFPFGIFIVLGAVIIYNSDLKWSDPIMIVLLIAGGIAGVVFATFIGSRVDLDDIAFRTESSADISELTKPKENIDENNS